MERKVGINPFKPFKNTIIYLCKLVKIARGLLPRPMPVKNKALCSLIDHHPSQTSHAPCPSIISHFWSSPRLLNHPSVPSKRRVHKEAIPPKRLIPQVLVGLFSQVYRLVTWNQRTNIQNQYMTNIHIQKHTKPSNVWREWLGHLTRSNRLNSNLNCWNWRMVRKIGMPLLL